MATTTGHILLLIRPIGAGKRTVAEPEVPGHLRRAHLSVWPSLWAE